MAETPTQDRTFDFTDSIAVASYSTIAIEIAHLWSRFPCAYTQR